MLGLFISDTCSIETALDAVIRIHSELITVTNIEDLVQHALAAVLYASGLFYYLLRQC